MDANTFFRQKEKPSMVDENPKSTHDIDIEFLTQLCYDGGMADDEIEEFVEAIIAWKNKMADRYREGFNISVCNVCQEIECECITDKENFEL